MRQEYSGGRVEYSLNVSKGGSRDQLGSYEEKILKEMVVD
jgi:hypothetical protein